MLLAEMLAKPGCPVTRLNVQHTGIPAEAVERLLTVSRIRAIELSELPVYSVRGAHQGDYREIEPALNENQLPL